MTARPDPAAAYTGRLINTDHRAYVPIQPTRDVSGLLPDPRWDGPRHYQPTAAARPSLLSRILKRLR